jgi:hypothetical protein
MVHKLEDKYLDCAAQSWERLADRSERDFDAEGRLSALSPKVEIAIHSR